MIHITNPINEWVVDTGATDHMSPDRSLFTNFSPIDNLVQQGKGRIRVLGTGSIFMNFILTNGATEQIELKNVLYMPDLFTNLLSVPRLHRNGYCFNTGKGTITDREQTRRLDLLTSHPPSGISIGSGRKLKTSPQLLYQPFRSRPGTNVSATATIRTSKKRRRLSPAWSWSSNQTSVILATLQNPTVKYRHDHQLTQLRRLLTASVPTSLVL